MTIFLSHRNLRRPERCTPKMCSNFNISFHSKEQHKLCRNPRIHAPPSTHEERWASELSQHLRSFNTSYTITTLASSILTNMTNIIPPVSGPMNSTGFRANLPECWGELNCAITDTKISLRIWECLGLARKVSNMNTNKVKSLL